MLFIEGVYRDSESDGCLTYQDICNTGAMAQSRHRKGFYRSPVISRGWPEKGEWFEQLLESLHL
ncbi:MAG: hypothetical protein WA705_12475 [Candidatus Ozemobacteraceae bacterium]